MFCYWSCCFLIYDAVTRQPALTSRTVYRREPGSVSPCVPVPVDARGADGGTASPWSTATRRKRPALRSRRAASAASVPRSNAAVSSMVSHCCASTRCRRCISPSALTCSAYSASNSRRRANHTRARHCNRSTAPSPAGSRPMPPGCPVWQPHRGERQGLARPPNHEEHHEELEDHGQD